ncbi:cytochrome P450 [Nocardia sp. NPDC003963]
MLAGADKDPTVFPDPERFDVTRGNAAEHLSFSSGLHGCPGADLARSRGTVALRALFERYPDLRPDGPPIPRGLVNPNSYRSMPARLFVGWRPLGRTVPGYRRGSPIRVCCIPADSRLVGC